MLTLKTVRELSQIDVEQWRDLLAHCPDSTVFQSPEWVGSWWNTFRDEQRTLNIIAAYQDDRLVGLAPLFIEPHTPAGLRMRRLRFLGDDQSDYHVFSTWMGSPDIVRQLLDAVRLIVQTNISAQLVEVPQFSALALCLNNDARGKLTGLKKSGVTACPRLRLQDNQDGVAAILRKTSLRRHFKALSGIGTVNVSHTTSPDEITTLLPQLFEQHIARWSGTPYPSLFNDPLNRSFYEKLAITLGSEQKIAFTTVRAGDRIVALHFGLRSRDEFIWYKPTFDMEFQRLSPGEVLLKALLEHASAQGYTAFDFSRGDEKFKSRFASSVDYNASYEWIPERPDRYALQIARHTRRVLLRAIGRRLNRGSARASEVETNPPQTHRALLLGSATESNAFVDIQQLTSQPSESPAPQITQLSPIADPSLTDPAKFTTWLEALNTMGSYQLIVPLSAEFADFTTHLTADWIRSKLLVPPPAALEMIARTGTLNADSTDMRIDASGIDPANQNELDALPPLRIEVECLADHGRMAWYFSTDLAGMSNPPLAPWRKAINEKAVLLSRKLLKHSRWHGFATLSFVVADRKLVLSSAGAYTHNALLGSRPIAADLLWSAINVRRGERSRAQPQLLRFGE